MPSDKEIYKLVLAEAWKDGVITDDERAMLDVLREAIGLTIESHTEIEISILNIHEGPIDVLEKSPEKQILVYLSEGNYQNAIETTESLLSKNPDDNEIICWQAIALSKIGKMDDAIAYSHNGNPLKPSRQINTAFGAPNWLTCRKF